MDPLKLSVKNFYAISKGQIDFSGLSSALILGSYADNPLKSNGSGKSSVFESISWALFNETRQVKIDDLIRWSADEAFVEFEFLFCGKRYKINRKRSRIAKESSVSLYAFENNQWINDSGSTNSETNKKILDLLKIDSKIFLNSAYFKQHDISLFANSSPADRKEIIKSIIKLEKWDEYQKKAKNELKRVKEEVDGLVKIVDENRSIVNQRTTINSALEVVKNKIDELIKQQKDAQSRLYELKTLKNENSQSFQLLVGIETKIEELKIFGKKQQNKQLELNNTIEIKTNKKDRCINNLLKAEEFLSDAENKLAVLQSGHNDYEILEGELLKARLAKGKVENEINDLLVEIDAGECNRCLSKISEDSLEKIINSRKEKIKSNKAQLIILNGIIENLEIDYKTRRLNKKALDELLTKHHNVKMELERLQDEKKGLEDEIVEYDKENIILTELIKDTIIEIKTKKNELDEIKSKIADNNIEDIGNKISAIEYENNKIANNLTAKNVELGSLIKEKEILEDKIKEVELANKALTKLNDDKASYEQLVRFFGRDGIQAVFIDNVIDELEKHANETLAHICNEPTIIKLRTQKKTGEVWQETLEIDVIMNGFVQTFESLSGGEKFRISLALRISLSEILVSRVGGEIKLLLLDEIDSPLDQYGIGELMKNIVKGLEKRFRILVISHNDLMKEYFTNVINVVKTQNGSLITQS